MGIVTGGMRVPLLMVGSLILMVSISPGLALLPFLRERD